MKELFYNILNQFCPNNVYLQGTLNANEKYPQKFITYFVTSTEDQAHYNNDVTAIRWDFSVMFYSDDPREVNTIPQQIRAALKNAGFIPQGRGNDLISDEITHTGWAMDFLYRENINNDDIITV